MYFLDLTLPRLTENLALDEALLQEAEAGGPELLRLWCWPSLAVVLGAAGRLAEDVEVEACRSDGVPIVRRSSGGGTVLLGPGCVAYSLILRFDRHPALAELRASYRFILERTMRALTRTEIDCQGSSDLTLAGRKFSGNAQQRKRTHFLHHGTLLYAFDISVMARYLKLPPRQPEYRGQRAHGDFVINLPLDETTIASGLRTIWDAHELLSNWPQERVRQLTAEKYDQEEWIRRR